MKVHCILLWVKNMKTQLKSFPFLHQTFIMFPSSFFQKTHLKNPNPNQNKLKCPISHHVLSIHKISKYSFSFFKIFTINLISDYREDLREICNFFTFIFSHEFAIFSKNKPKTFFGLPFKKLITAEIWWWDFKQIWSDNFPHLLRPQSISTTRIKK